ncbi:hypothetical protein B0I31_101120 [Saccharothrix carnea]|uniref:Uncharacterized protein n=1 Tax=Saccharothrix carnea TaxID=1280637 RepID=A0A2P8IHG3_SACCR|nr:hypothetical protein [Saccharothrix carnea]PSL57906.1 hypothetical protein B0I31_101120 [Saccharothrix carnea]
MRVLWATCGLAVAASALIGVLIGVYLDGVKDEQQAETPASTWITGRPSTVGSSTTPPSAVTTDALSSPRSSTTTVRTTTTTPPPAAPPPPPETTAEAPPTTTTTTRVKSTEWPCSPINPLPPPHCRD